MTAVILPATPLPRAASPRPLEYGGWQTPIVGGPELYLGRLGNRWAIDFQTPRMKPEPTGRVWSSALVRSIGQMARAIVPQPGLEIGTPGSPVVNGAGQTGTTVSLRGFAAGYVIRDGQFLSFTDGTYLYLHRATADATANGSGVVSVPLWPMLRQSFADGAAVNVAAPLIEGKLIGSAQGWTMARARVDGLSFTVMEVR